jgi:hypothetical protein
VAKSSEVSVSDEDRKTLRNLDNEIADRVKEFANIMSKYVDVSVESNFVYSRKTVEGGPSNRPCINITYHTEAGGVWCADECRGICYEGPCRPPTWM